MSGPHDTTPPPSVPPTSPLPDDPPSAPGLLAVPVIRAGHAERTLEELFAKFFDAWLEVEGAALAVGRALDSTATATATEAP
jgi:hypothetical protein